MGNQGKTRQQRILELYGEPDTEQEEEILKEMAETQIRQQNERMWAFYADGQESLTQSEAHDRAISDIFSMSQATASRVIRETRDDILTAPVESVNPRLDNRDLSNMPDELLEAYRTVLARAIVDLEALGRFSNGERETPQWARERFPDLDPDVGREFYKAAGIDVELHPPMEDTKQSAPADD